MTKHWLPHPHIPHPYLPLPHPHTPHSHLPHPDPHIPHPHPPSPSCCMPLPVHAPFHIIQCLVIAYVIDTPSRCLDSYIILTPADIGRHLDSYIIHISADRAAALLISGA